MKVSIYPNAYSNQTKQTEPFKSVIQKIKDGFWQDPVINYRAGRSKKEKIPAFTPSGLFAGKRKASELTKHSGIINIDIDAKQNESYNLVDMRAELYADKYTHAGFISVSGAGLVLFVKINPQKHAESFEALSKYYANNYKLVIDESGKDTSRLRFVSYDPEAYYNENADKWVSYIEKKERKPTTYKPVFVQDDIDYVLQQIQRTGTDITSDYDEWVRVGFALASEYGEAGRDKFHIVSANYHGYDYAKCDKKYDNFVKHASGRAGIGTFFWLAKKAGLQIRTPKTESIVKIATIRKRQVGKSGGAKSDEHAKSETIKYLEEFEGITKKDSEQLVEQVFALKEAELKSNENQLSEIEILTDYIKTLDIRHNEITDRIEYKGDDITDKMLNTIFLDAKLTYPEIKFTKEIVMTIIESDRIKSYNPFVDFFEKNKHLKPKGNISKLLSCIETEDNKYAKFVGNYVEKWLISIISSALDVHSIMTLVLIGEQGTQKTNFFRGLLPEPLKRYYAESKLDNGKDDELLMTRRLIVMDDEFGGKSKKEATKFKDLSSKEAFTNRKPYGRFEEERKRYAVLCGTSNEREILNDPTGNRRIIPVYIVNFDMEKYKTIDRTELFMELYHRWRELGDKWMLTKEDVKNLNETTASFFEVTPEEDAINTYFSKDGDEFMTTTEMIAYAEYRIGSNTRLYFKRFGQLLKKNGFKQTSKYNRKGYIVGKL